MQAGLRLGCCQAPESDFFELMDHIGPNKDALSSFLVVNIMSVRVG